MRKLFIAAAIIATSFSALADGEPYVHPKLTGSTTRAQVLSELQSARAAGLLVSGEGGSVDGMHASAASHPGPTLSRAEVRAELNAALRNGELASGEFGASMPTHRSTGSHFARSDAKGKLPQQ